MTDSLDVLIIGAGLVGLAIARALARVGRDVVVIDRELSPGQHASSRNSEVLHAGLYYPAGSLKARLCMQGRASILQYCAARDIDVQPVGKLVVATAAHQQRQLDRLYARARANGVEGLRRLNPADLRVYEPHLQAWAGLLSPHTSIIDSHALMRALWIDAEHHGARFAFATPFVAAQLDPSGFLVDTADTRVRCRWLINAAGLDAVRVAHSLRGFPAHALPRAYLCKGSYFRLTGPSPFGRLIYPLPDTASLGIHITLDLDGRARVGPDQQWVDHLDYTVDPDRAPLFARAVARYYPGLDPSRLEPDYAGYRAKIHGPGQPPSDFVIQGPADHGIEGLCHLLGIESPGLSACLAVADEVLVRLGVEPRALF